jgi:hypothetical protein
MTQTIYANQICQEDHNPVLSVRVNPLKQFAFVELSTPDICDAVMAKMNNCAPPPPPPPPLGCPHRPPQPVPTR